MSNEMIHYIQLNGGHIEVYKDSVVFADDDIEEQWEYSYPELFKLTDRDREV